MSGRLFVVSGGAAELVDPECRIRPEVDCAQCHAPVEKQLLLRDGDGGWSIIVSCHGKREIDEVLWRDLLAGDVVVGPAFDPALVLVRRAS